MHMHRNQTCKNFMSCGVELHVAAFRHQYCSVENKVVIPVDSELQTNYNGARYYLICTRKLTGKDKSWLAVPAKVDLDS